MPMKCLSAIKLVVLRVIINRLRNRENCQKLENCPSSKNWLSQEKNCQQVWIYLILMLKKTGQAF